MGSALPTTPTTTTRMAQVQGNNLLDVLKKKMRQTKEEMEKYKEESEDMARKLQVEIRRREEAEGEVAALNRRIQLLEEDLERSEERLATATQKLAEASHAADESERIRKALENKSNMEDDRAAILEAQLAQAKLIAEEATRNMRRLPASWPWLRWTWKGQRSAQKPASPRSSSSRRSRGLSATTSSPSRSQRRRPL